MSLAPGDGPPPHRDLTALLTGLAELYDDASSLSGATFTRRFAAEMLESLSDSDLRDALHPFVFQLAGQAAWDAGDGARITRRQVELGWRFASREARDHVERQLSRLPGKERALLDAMAGLEEPERNATRIAHRMGHDSATQIGPTAQRLDRVRGLIDRGRRYR